MKKIILIPSLIILLIGCKKDTDTQSEPTIVYIYSAVASPTASESVTIKNNSGVQKDLHNWKLGDSNNSNAYNIPSGVILNQGETYTLYASTLNFQINDSGETLYLKDTGGSIIDTWSN